jgi:hypothetical protein
MNEMLCCPVQVEALRRADNSSKGVLPNILIRLRNLQCEAAKVLTRTVQPLMMIIIINYNSTESLSLL